MFLGSLILWLALKHYVRDLGRGLRQGRGLGLGCGGGLGRGLGRGRYLGIGLVRGLDHKGIKMAKREFILFISDLQAPAMHPDTVTFLRATVKKYGKPTRVIQIGDEADQEALNEYGKNPDLPSDGYEIDETIRTLRPIYKMFPRVDLLYSNHVLRARRKAHKAGLSQKRFKEWREVIHAPRNWRWYKSLLLRTCIGQTVFVCHGRSANGLQLAKEMGCSVVQGHYHTKYCIEYTSNPANLNFSLQVGCSIHTKHAAFNYDAENVKRPIIGHAAIINGFPKLLPMLLDKRGRWTGVVP